MVHVITDSCVACGTCIDECPIGVTSGGDIYSIDADTCVNYGAYAAAYSSGAIED